jgi:hypothetical protein
MEERVFFEHGPVRVTNARFIVDTRTYAMNGVTSVNSSITAPTRGLPLGLMIVGALMLLGGGVGVKVLGAALIGVGIWVWSQQKSTHAVFLSSASGEVQALADTDEQYINGVVHALNEALVHRG